MTSLYQAHKVRVDGDVTVTVHIDGPPSTTRGPGGLLHYQPDEVSVLYRPDSAGKVYAVSATVTGRLLCQDGTVGLRPLPHPLVWQDPMADGDPAFRPPHWVRDLIRTHAPRLVGREIPHTTPSFTHAEAGQLLRTLYAADPHQAVAVASKLANGAPDLKSRNIYVKLGERIHIQAALNQPGRQS